MAENDNSADDDLDIDDILSAASPDAPNHILESGGVPYDRRKTDLIEEQPDKQVKSKKSTAGRPKKDKSERLSKKILVNLTEDEYKKIEALSKKYLDAPLGKVIRAALKDGNVI